MSIDGKSQHIVSLLWRGVLFLMRCYAVNQHAWRDLRGPLVSSQILKLPAFYYHVVQKQFILHLGFPRDCYTKWYQDQYNGSRSFQFIFFAGDWRACHSTLVISLCFQIHTDLIFLGFKCHFQMSAFPNHCVFKLDSTSAHLQSIHDLSLFST